MGSGTNDRPVEVAIVSSCEVNSEGGWFVVPGVM